METTKRETNCKVIEISNNSYSIIKNSIPYSLSINNKDKCINLTMSRQLATYNYEGIFTYEDFIKLSKFFFLYDTLDEIYKMLKAKIDKQEVDLQEEKEFLDLKFEFNINDDKNYKISLKIPKNPEMDIKVVIDNMSKTILQLIERINVLENKKLITKSLILKKEEMEMVKKWLGFDPKYELLYRSSKHGKGSNDFHNKCDNRGPTITFVETTDGFRFGGYTSLTWDSNGGQKSNDLTAFLFSLDKKKKLTYNNQNYYIIHCNPSDGPIFGAGEDLYVANNFDGSSSILTSFGKSEGVSQSYLTGSETLYIKEVEVYSVTK